MLKPWGTRHVSSAWEVYDVLAHPPTDSSQYECWKELLNLEPPVWGSRCAACCAHAMAARGVRVWSWDDHGVVTSDAEEVPPQGVAYQEWSDLHLQQLGKETRTP